MKIAIDIGNTSVTCGLFKKNSLIEKKEMGSLNSFKSFINNLNFGIERIIISSVVILIVIAPIFVASRACRKEQND